MWYPDHLQEEVSSCTTFHKEESRPSCGYGEGTLCTLNAVPPVRNSHGLRGGGCTCLGGCLEVCCIPSSCLEVCCICPGGTATGICQGTVFLWMHPALDMSITRCVQHWTCPSPDMSSTGRFPRMVCSTTFFCGGTMPHGGISPRAEGPDGMLCPLRKNS